MTRHLDALFAMAQVLTLDAENATTLVEDTFKRALQIRERNLVVPGDRRHMLQLLIQVHNEKKQPSDTYDTGALTLASQAQSTESFKQHILDQFLSRVVPASFALLDDADRLVLSLCEANRLSLADAALIMGIDSDAVGLQLQNAKHRLQERVVSNAPPAILELLKQSKPDEWVPQSLRRALKSELKTTSPTLETRVQSVFTRQHPEAARQALAATSEKKKIEGRSPFSRGLMTVFLVLSAGFIGYIGSTLFQGNRDTNLLTLSAARASRVETVLATADPSEAEQFVSQQMNWRLHLPEIENVELTGVGISEITDDVRVPVFQYRDLANPDNKNITIYAFTYALLDEYADRIQLQPDILTAIANEDRFDLHDLSDREKFVIWRNSDDIFMAVTEGNPMDLRNRISLDRG